MAFQPIEKISIYKEYDVDHELLLPAYVSLCRSPTLPSPAEGKILTLETVLKIASAREQVLQTASERGYKTPLSASVPDDVVNTIVAELFGLTPHSGQTVGFEGQAMNNGTSSGDNSVDTGEVITVKQPHKKGRMNGAASQELPPATVSQGNSRAIASAHQHLNRQNGTGANKVCANLRTFCLGDSSEPNIGQTKARALVGCRVRCHGSRICRSSVRFLSILGVRCFAGDDHLGNRGLFCGGTIVSL